MDSKESKFKQWAEKLTRRSLLINGIRLGFAIGISIFIAQFDFEYLESYTYDVRTRLRPAVKPSDNIVTVAILRSTVNQFKKVPGAKEHTELIRQMASGKPRAIIYLLNPDNLVGSYEELEQLAEIAEQIPHFTVAYNDILMKGEENKFTLNSPLEKIKVSPGPYTRDTKIFAQDGVTRRTMISYQNQTLMHYEIASMINPELKYPDGIRGAWNFLDSVQTYIDFSPTGSYKKYSFEEVYNGRLPQETFKDKIIIVGRDTGTSSKDYVKTPFSRDIENLMSLPELHANMIDSLIRNSSPLRTGRLLDIVFTTLISILTIWVVLALRPLKGLLILLGSLGLYLLISFVALWPFGFWIGMAHPLLAIFICYYFFIPYRLIMENRRGWEYQQKNKLLTQVEELKTNFIGMMSHDLKTPLARIQGMSDVIIKEQQNLSATQREAVHFIKNSTIDLTKFISSILNFGRIESSGVQLHLQSKDINTVLDQVIKKCDYSAAQKKIQIITEFEPLFSVKVDPDLLNQVFANLVENAIKYSHEESKILVSTEEMENKIIVQVADQGIGIPEDEIDNVFMKFFRSKDAKQSLVKGSGLGLYLAKYFVELHKGAISVESSYGQGSTFTVELPVDS